MSEPPKPAINIDAVRFHCRQALRELELDHSGERLFDVQKHLRTAVAMLPNNRNLEHAAHLVIGQVLIKRFCCRMHRCAPNSYRSDCITVECLGLRPLATFPRPHQSTGCCGN